jgi:non-homologous end joining protein Ku
MRQSLTTPLTGSGQGRERFILEVERLPAVDRRKTGAVDHHITWFRNEALGVLFRSWHPQTLTLNTLRFASEIRSADELRLPANEKLIPNEVNLALKLIEGMTADFDPAKYHDTYTEDVKKLIEDKAKGEKRQAPAPKPVRSNVIDLVAALQESLAQKKPRKRDAW